MSDNTMPLEIRRLLDHFTRMELLGNGLPADDTPIGVLTREFFANNWQNCRDGLLENTTRIRVRPEPSPYPRVFNFEIDCRFKSKAGSAAPVETKPGPVRGTAYYRPDVLTASDAPPVAVALNADQEFFHPNYNRRQDLSV